MSSIMIDLFENYHHIKALRAIAALIAVVLLSAPIQVALAAEKANYSKGGSEVVRIGYSRAIKPVDAEIWGMAQGDLDGDGKIETILAEREQILIGDLKGKSFKKRASCDWPGIAQAATVYAMDLDGDGDDEVILSAVEEGAPSSMILDYEAGSCKRIATRLSWTMRVAYLPAGWDGEESKGRQVLIGQGWSRSNFFAGALYELKLNGSKIERVKKLKLPWKTRIYQFAFVPEIDGDPALVEQRGYERLEAKRRKGRKFKRAWRSGQRFGGSINFLSAEQRVALGQEQSDIVIFDTPPLVVGLGESAELVALRADMPLKGFVGRRPYVKGGGIYGFKRDEVFTFTESFQTTRLPGAITDVIVARDGDEGVKRIYVVMIEDPAFFDKSSRSIIVSFDLPVSEGDASEKK
jgi:FG-GAP-like repeat